MRFIKDNRIVNKIQFSGLYHIKIPSGIFTRTDHSSMLNAMGGLFIKVKFGLLCFETEGNPEFCIRVDDIINHYCYCT